MASILATGTLLLASSAGMAPAPHTPRPACPRTFTIGMFRRAAIVAYRGTRTPTRRDLAHLRRFVRCARHPWARPVDRRIWARSRRMNASRRQAAAAPTNVAIASWFDDSGATASGWHAYYGFANLYMAFGTRVEFCYGGRCVTGVCEDRGPYVGGRTFDLNQNMHAVLGFDGVAPVRWKVVG